MHIGESNSKTKSQFIYKLFFKEATIKNTKVISGVGLSVTLNLGSSTPWNPIHSVLGGAHESKLSFIKKTHSMIW